MENNSKFHLYYNTFREISRIIHSSIDMEEVLELIVWKAAEALQAKGAALRILNLDTQQLELSASHGLSDNYFAIYTHLSSSPLLAKQSDIIWPCCKCHTRKLPCSFQSGSCPFKSRPNK